MMSEVIPGLIDHWQGGFFCSECGTHYTRSWSWAQADADHRARGHSAALFHQNNPLNVIVGEKPVVTNDRTADGWQSETVEYDPK